MSLPNDLILNAADEIAIRQHLLLVSMGKRPADRAVEVGRLLAVHANHWLDNQEIIVSGRRIAYVGPIGSYRGEVAERVKYPQLSAVPGFGEVHKHIESTHLTPEFEAALVIPRGNTWTCEASHEFANVNGPKNTEFWQKARRAGSPLKVFIQPGSAVPPSTWEESGGYYGYDEQKQFLREELSATGLDEVMDWPSVWDPTNPGYIRMWGMIRATFEMRGVVEGHGNGLTDLQWVGSISPGRYADIVLLGDVPSISIAHVYADGQLASTGKTFTGPMPVINWPDWASKSMNIGRTLTAADFAIAAEPGRDTMQAAILKPFHWDADYLVETLPVADGQVQRDSTRTITKWSLIDRYRGDGAVASMFWIGCGPEDPDTALACSVAHDSHNVWCIGSSDEAMALAVNHLQSMDGGWVLVHRGEVVATVRFEIAGLMTARPAEALDAEMATFLKRAAEVTWMYQPAAMNRWKPGFPEFLIFATLTCSPWRWVLVAPSKLAPNGFVNVQTGETHPVVW